MTKFAIFFKCHYWGELENLNYKKLLLNNNSGDIYILFDNTKNSPPEGIDNLITINSSDIHNNGLLDHGGYWYNGDYSSIIAFLNKPRYNYYVFVEYDVAVFKNIDSIIYYMKCNDIDVIAQEILDNPWAHTDSCNNYYDKFVKALCCICFLSREAIVSIYKRRLMQKKLKESLKLNHWPIGEAVIPTECIISNLKYENLSNLCSDLKNYTWNLAIEENFLPIINPENTFLHPVVDSNKFERIIFSTINRADDNLIKKISHSKNEYYFYKAYYLPENSEEDKNKILKCYRNIFQEKKCNDFLFKIIPLWDSNKNKYDVYYNGKISKICIFNSILSPKKIKMDPKSNFKIIFEKKINIHSIFIESIFSNKKKQDILIECEINPGYRNIIYYGEFDKISSKEVIVSSYVKSINISFCGEEDLIIQNIMVIE